MNAALAIFVKTPGLSPIKTRLAVSIGRRHAEQFHRLAAQAVAETARACGEQITPYWAVAEDVPAAQGAWAGFALIGQGQGYLGARLHHVYASLLEHHDRVLLIGADTPQLGAHHIQYALDTLSGSNCAFVMGAARDGGFWLFGGRAPIAPEVWNAVTYSQDDTGATLRRLLPGSCDIDALPQLVDVDSADDLQALRCALAELKQPSPAQRRLCEWLDSLTHETVSNAPQPAMTQAS